MDNYKDWTVFLDRDGVINKKAAEHDYIKNWSEFEFLPGSFDAIVKLNEIFGRIIIVSNQQGFSKGVISVSDLEEINVNMLNDIFAHGGNIDFVLYCLHHEKENCGCRKPKIGLAIRAKTEFHDINFSKSVTIGDSLSDMEFGTRIGSFNVLVCNSTKTISDNDSFMSDGIFESLYDFAYHPMLFSPRWKTHRENLVEWSPLCNRTQEPLKDTE